MTENNKYRKNIRNVMQEGNIRDSLLEKYIGPWKEYCEGFGNSLGYSYICGFSAVVGKFETPFKSEILHNLDSISAYDKAEAIGPYLGQLNMIKVTSFCGPKGRLWGYDIVRHSDYIDKKDSLRIDEIEVEHHGREIPVYSARPLLKATEDLFGTQNERHFPIMPGSMVPCVFAFDRRVGPIVIYSGMGFGIPAKKDRGNNAIILMQDVGTGGDVAEKTKNTSIRAMPTNKHEVEMESQRILAESVALVAKNQNIDLKEILVYTATRNIKINEQGFALSAAPFFLLAQNAVPFSKYSDIEKITLQEWNKKVRKDFYSSR